MARSNFEVFSISCFLFIVCCDGWRAVPVNKASFAFSNFNAGGNLAQRIGKNVIPDELLPREYLHSVYKFGYCPPEVTIKQYLRSSANMSFENYRDTYVDYIYLIADMHSTMRFKLQCVVMRFYVPRRYLFAYGRIPIYYCQGQLFIMMFDSVQRMAVHEFYFSQPLSIPMDVFFEFYHPTIL